MMTSEERERRRPWGRFEEAAGDALTLLYEAIDGLPEGEPREDIEDWMRFVDRRLNEAVEVAIQAAHDRSAP